MNRFYQYIPNDYKSVFVPYPTKEIGETLDYMNQQDQEALNYSGLFASTLDKAINAFTPPDIETKKNIITEGQNKINEFYQKALSNKNPMGALPEMKSYAMKLVADSRIANINATAAQKQQDLKMKEEVSKLYLQKNGNQQVLMNQWESEFNTHDSNEKGVYNPYKNISFVSPSDLQLKAIDITKALGQKEDGSMITYKYGNEWVRGKYSKSTNAVIDDKGNNVTDQFITSELARDPETVRAAQYLGMGVNAYVAPFAQGMTNYTSSSTKFEPYVRGNYLDDMIKKKSLEEKPIQPEQGLLDYTPKQNINDPNEKLKSLIGDSYLNHTGFINTANDIMHQSTKTYNEDGYAVPHSENVDAQAMHMLQQLAQDESLKQNKVINIQEIPDYRKKLETFKANIINEINQENIRLKTIWENTPALQQIIPSYRPKDVINALDKMYKDNSNNYDITYTPGTDVDWKKLNRSILHSTKDGDISLNILNGKTVVPLKGKNANKAVTFNIELSDYKDLTGSVANISAPRYYIHNGEKKMLPTSLTIIDNKGNEYALVDHPIGIVGNTPEVIAFTEAKDNIGTASFAMPGVGYVNYLVPSGHGELSVEKARMVELDYSGIVPSIVEKSLSGQEVVSKFTDEYNNKYNVISHTDENGEISKYAVSNNNVYLLTDPTPYLNNEMYKASYNLPRQK